MQGLIQRYGRWQLRDFVVERGVWILAAGLAMLAIFWLNYDTAPPPHLTDPGFIMHMPAGPRDPLSPAQRQAAELARWIADEPRRFADTLQFTFGIFGFVGTLIATHGIVSRDRERGFYRFLFAKPVEMAAFYGQAFAINFAGVMATTAALLGTSALVFGRAVPVTPLAVVATEYALLGGTVFLLSTVWRFDFVLAALSWPAAMVVAALAHDARPGPLWASALEPLLPPMHFFGEFVEAVYGPKLVDGFDAVVVVGYGVLCFAAGLYVLDRRSRAVA